MEDCLNFHYLATFVINELKKSVWQEKVCLMLRTCKNVIYLTTITTGPGFLCEFVRLSLKTCSVYHEKLSIQVVNGISSQIFNNYFSASDRRLSEAVSVYGMKVA